jgi:hypothetical protein
MSLKENVNSVLRAVGLKAVEIKLAQMKSEDGVTVFEAESFEADYSVGISTEEGIVPCPVGEYTLEDGSIMVVLVEGVIAEIKPMEEAEAEVEVEVETPEVAPVAMEEAQTVKKVVESITKETFFSEIEALKKENIELKAQLEAKVEVVELAEEKEVDPIRFNPENSKPVESFRYAKSASQTTLDRVLNKLNN